MNKVITLKTSNNYEMFEMLDFNRDVTKTKNLEVSMKKHGFIAAYPLHVIRIGGILKIKGGHHRFTVAKKLGLSVAYVECNDNSSIHELELATVKWTMSDYLMSYFRLKIPPYIIVYDYVHKTGINVSMAASMLAGELATSHNVLDDFKTGKYNIAEDNLYPESVGSIVLACKSVGIDFAITYNFVGALSRVAMAGHADMTRLKNKIITFNSAVKKQSSLNDYLILIEEIYNKQQKDSRIPLAFLTNETIAKKAHDMLFRSKDK